MSGLAQGTVDTGTVYRPACGDTSRIDLGTLATLALRRGVPVEVVSKVLGHARVSITLDVYRHVLDNERRALVIDLFDAVPSTPPATLPALN